MTALNGGTPPKSGTVTTSNEDWFTRAIAQVRLPVVALGALGVYVLFAVAIPELSSPGGVALVAYTTVGTILALELVLLRLLPIIDARLRRQRLEVTTNLRLLSAKDFEELTAEMFRHEGWNVSLVGQHGQQDGGIDLRLHRGTEVRLVQCKRWTARLVPVETVRSLGGVVAAEGLEKGAGILVTTSDITRQAAAEARRLQVEVIDGKALVPRLEAAGATGALKEVALGQAPWPCPKCGASMVLDQSRFGWWLRCAHYRNGCDGKRDLGSDPQQALEALRMVS